MRQLTHASPNWPAIAGFASSATGATGVVVSWVLIPLVLSASGTILGLWGRDEVARGAASRILADAAFVLGAAAIVANMALVATGDDRFFGL